MADRKRTMLVVPVDMDVKNSFKSTCADNGANMSDVLKQFINEYIRDNKNKKRMAESA